MKKNTLVKNASVLMAATIISRIIGLIYRRPLGEILGPVGLGYYGYASNLYSILLLVSSYSIPMAVSKIVSERLAKKEYKNSFKIFKGALIYAVIVGAVAAVLALAAGGILLPSNQQNAVPALRVLAPAIFLSAILGVLRGYFQAHHTMAPTSISQIAEQIINAVVSILAAWILVSGAAAGDAADKAIRGSMGGTMGTFAGVITALAFMYLVYYANKGYFAKRVRKDRTRRTEGYGDIFWMLFTMMTPIILTTFINNASNYLDSYMYSVMIGRTGVDSRLIAAAYGEFSNYYIPVINIPLALASASASAMMPEVSAYYAVGRRNEANACVRQTIKLTMFICMPATVGLTVLAMPIMGVLFPASSNLSAQLLMTGSVYVIFTALATITGCVLQSIGKQRTAMINAAIALGANLVFLAVILLAFPGLDIFAVMIANILFSVVYCFINAVSIRKYLGFRFEFKESFSQPLFISALMAVVAVAVYYALFNLTRRPFISLLIAIIVAVIAYLILYVKICRVDEFEVRKLPLGGKIVRFLKLIHIYR